MSSEQHSDRLGFPDWSRTVSLIALVGLSGGIVWSFHHFDRPFFIAVFIAGCFLGVLAGGLVGIHSPSSLGTMALLGGILEGIVQGWTRGGFVGLLLGGFFGVGVAVIFVMLLLMLTHAVMIVCGKDPYSSLRQRL